MRKFSTKNNTARGFTLIETLVAILILSIAVAGSMTIAQKSLQTALYSRDETTAYYLASEGIELVRNIRDTNSMLGNDWLTSITPNIYFDIHPTDLAQTQCATTPTGATVPVCTLFTDANNVNGWGPNAGFTNATNFSRSIIVTKNQDDEATVSVTVVWKSGPFSVRQITLQEHIFNWR